MDRDLSRVSVFVAAAVVILAVGLAEWARADKIDASRAAAGPRKIDHPFVTYALGTWDWTSTVPQAPGGAAATAGAPADEVPADRGTETFALGLLGTAVIDEIDGTAAGKAFQGHGVWRLSADGATLSAWWFFSADAAAMAYEGAIGPDGFEVENATGGRLTMKRTPTGLELKAYEANALARTVTYTKR
jgi:hypothetical protein